MRTIGAGVVAFGLAAASAGCDAPHAPTPRLWTVADVRALYPGGEDGTGAIAIDAGLPGGVKLDKILDATDPSKLAARATIAEGYDGAYLTTEVWTHFDEVWLQPMYIPVTVATDGALTPVMPADGSSSWIFSVGPGSRFYSPFWQMVYVEVKPDTPPITSARQVLDGKYPLQFGPGRTVSLLPGGVAPPDPLTKGTAWIDGRQTSFVDFGKQTFTWNAEAVIDEVPIYIFLMRNSQGELVAPDIPTVAGTGPPGSGGPAPPMVDNHNRYVTYWRLYTVTLPATARVFSPTAELQMKLGSMGADVPVVTSYTQQGTDHAQQLGWVALNPVCFETEAQLDPDPGVMATGEKCMWLSSQAAIEKNVDRSAIQRTEVTVTCPFVRLAGEDVSPIK